MKNIIYLWLFFCMFYINCNRPASNASPEIIQVNEKTESIFSEIQKDGILLIENKNIGIYFPENYIEDLLETRSHMVSSYKLYDIFSELSRINKNINAIIIFEDEIHFVIHFHEGVQYKIMDISNNKIIFENPYNSMPNIFVIDEYTIKDENDFLFIKINGDINNWRIEIESYITEIIFGNKVYKNDIGNVIYRLENGKIYYNDIEYQISTNTVFNHKEYDTLYSRGQKNIYFRINNDIINIFQIKIPEGSFGDPMDQILGEYILIDEYK